MRQFGRRFPAVGQEPIHLRQTGAMVLHADPFDLHRREPVGAGRHAAGVAVAAEVEQHVRA